MIYRYIILLSLAFGGGWQINQWRHDSHEKQAIEAAAVAQRELHRLEQARASAALGAQVVARKSEARLRADAAASQSAYVGLRDTTDAALRAASADLTACTAISASLSELFTDSAARYRELASKADGHVIDLKLQIDTP